MKKFFKLGCLGIIGLFVLAIIIGIASGGGNKSSSKPEANTANQSDSKPTVTKQAGTNKQDSQQLSATAPSDSGVLTKEKFDQIKDGMTYDQVSQIIGSKGELLSETGEKGTEYYTVLYSFKAQGDLGANSTMMFQGGKLINKAQFGLGGSSNVTITKAKFDQIQNGMTYEQVQQIIGGLGETLSESGEKGTEFYTIMVEYKGEGGLGANANFVFQGNKLQSKSQLGL